MQWLFLKAIAKERLLYMPYTKVEKDFSNSSIEKRTIKTIYTIVNFWFFSHGRV